MTPGQIAAERDHRYRAALQAYKQAKEAGMTHKVWLSSHDRRTRHDHRNADGQRKPMGQPFMLGGARLHLPNDPTVPLDQTAHCRCSVRYYRDEDETVARDEAMTYGPPSDPPGLQTLIGDQEGTVAATRPPAQQPTQAAAPPVPPKQTALPETSPSGVPWPVPKPFLTSKFGPRIPPAEGASAFHIGIDLDAPVGTPISSTHDGTVLAIRFNSASGNHIFIQNADGSLSSYSHTAASDGIREGVAVTAGQPIGKSDNSGISSNPHLHYVYRPPGATAPANPRSSAVDPLTHLFGFRSGGK